MNWMSTWGEHPGTFKHLGNRAQNSFCNQIHVVPDYQDFSLKGIRKI